MEQVLVKRDELENIAQLEEVIILGKLPTEVEYYELAKIKPQKKQLKKALLKIIKKAKYNANYHQELIPIGNIKRNVNYRNYGVY